MADRSGFSRRTLMQTAALGLLAGCASHPLPPGASLTSNTVPVPAPARIPYRIEQLGRVRNDPYRWLKFIPETGARSIDTLPEQLRKHLKAEAEYAAAMLAPVRTKQSAMLDRMMARLPPDEQAPPLTAVPWAYFSFYPKDSAHIVHARKLLAGGTQEILLDEAQRASQHRYYRTTAHQFSPDHAYFAWAEDVIGNDRHRICVRNNATGEISIPVKKDAYGYGGVVISPSSEWLFWIWRDDKNRPKRLYRTSLATAETALVYEESDPAIFMQIARTAADGYIAVTLAGPDTSEVRLISATDETAEAELVFARRDQVHYEINEWLGNLLMLTDEDGALDNALISLSANDTSNQETLVPHRPGSQILKVVPFAKALMRLERSEGQQQLVLRSPDGAEQTIAFDETAYTVSIEDGQSYSSEQCRITYQSPKSPLRWMDVDLETGATTLVQKSEVPDFNPDDYVVERAFAAAPDGEQVPVTLLSRGGAPRDGSAPCLLYGYGAYGISSEPEFSIPATILVDRGWTYAIAHVRGGSEKGRQWFLGGRRFKKRNSFTDFVACAEMLCNRKITSPGSLVAYGLLAGGLLVGGAMNEAPELWGGVIAKVPFVDMLNTMSDADHPLVPLFRPDWGDPLADPVAYDYMASISPYENVSASNYPPLLCTAGLKDDRVGYWEAAKFVAEVRYRSTSSNPAILLLDVDSGHQGSGNRRAEFEEMALFWGFAETALAGGFPAS